MIWIFVEPGCVKTGAIFVLGEEFSVYTMKCFMLLGKDGV